MNIPLTNSSLVAIIDDEDAALVCNKKWFLHGRPGFFYAVTTTKPILRMHHLINGKPPKGMETDHRDRNTLNNRRCNLRNATKSQNQANALHTTSKDGIRGVTHRTKNSWEAQIRVKGVWKHIGSFSSPQAAAKAYDDAARMYFGEFARTNGQGN